MLVKKLKDTAKSASKIITAPVKAATKVAGVATKTGLALGMGGGLGLAGLLLYNNKKKKKQQEEQDPYNYDY